MYRKNAKEGEVTYSFYIIKKKKQKKKQIGNLNTLGPVIRNVGKYFSSIQFKWFIEKKKKSYLQNRQVFYKI